MNTVKTIAVSICLASLSLSAQATVDIVAPEKPSSLVESIEVAGEYYLYNTGAGKFLAQSTIDGTYCGWSDTPHTIRFDSADEDDNHFALWQGENYMQVRDGRSMVEWAYSEEISNDVIFNVINNGNGMYELRSIGGSCFGKTPHHPLYASFMENHNCNTMFRVWLLIPTSLSDDEISEMIYYSEKQILYNALLDADREGYLISRYVAIYNNVESTSKDFREASNILNTSMAIKHHDSWFFSGSDYGIMVGLNDVYGPAMGDALYCSVFGDNYFKCSSSFCTNESSTVFFKLETDDYRPFKVYLDGVMVMECNDMDDYARKKQYYLNDEGFRFNVDNTGEHNVDIVITNNDASAGSFENIRIQRFYVYYHYDLDNSWLFPMWSEAPIGLLNFDGFTKDFRENYAKYGSSWQYGDTATISAAVSVNETSDFMFRIASEKYLEYNPSITLKVFVDGNLALSYNGSTWYNDRLDSNWLYNYNNEWNSSDYRPEGNSYNVDDVYYEASRYFHVDIQPGKHNINIEIINNDESNDATNVIRLYEMAVVKASDYVVADISNSASLIDAILEAVGMHDYDRVKKIKVVGEMSNDDWDAIYEKECILALDLSGVTNTSIKHRKLSSYYHPNLKYLRELILPESLEYIEAEAFLGLNADIAVPSSVKRIGSYAFANTRTSQANMPNVETIGAGAFMRCSNLTSVSASALTKIEGSAFANCHSLRNASLNGTVEVIPDYCFYKCNGIETISLPDCVKEINRRAFYECNKSTLARLPHSMVRIGENAFYNNYSASLDLPASVRLVESEAFSNAFRNNPLDSLHLPNGCDFGNAAFQNTKIRNLVMTGRLTTDMLFNGCDSIESIKMMSPVKIDEISSNVFGEGLVRDSIIIYVPAYQKNAYDRDSYWTAFKEIRTFGNEELQDIAVENDFIMPSDFRFNWIPNLDIYYNVALEIEGSQGMNLNDVRIRNNGQVMTETDEINIVGNLEEYIWTDGLRWNLLSLPFDCEVAKIKTDNNADFVIRYYDGEKRASGESSGYLIDSNLHPYPESEHNYVDNMTESTPGNKQTFTYEDAERLYVSFSASTDFENYYDYLHIRDNSGNERTYSGQSLALQVIQVNGNSFDIWITSDGSITRYGYSIDAIYANEMPAGGTHSNSWANSDINDIIPAGKGFAFMTSASTHTHFYAVDNDAKRTVFASSVNPNNEKYLPLERYESEVSQNAGWNLVGNPYQNYYNIRKLNFLAPITVYNVEDRMYHAYSLTDDNYNLSPLQAFFVQCPASVSEISFPLSGCQLSTGTIVDTFAPSARDMEADVLARQIVDLTLTIDSLTDDSRVVMNEEAQMEYETICDAAKFMSMDNSVPQLYSHNGGVQYAINERPVADGNVKLGVYLPKAGTYTLAVSRNQAEKVMLTDKQLDRTVELTATGYSFDAEAGTWDGRFEINVIRMMPTNIENVADADAQNDEAVFYDMNGRMVSAAQADGIYVKVQGGKSQKVNVMR